MSDKVPHYYVVSFQAVSILGEMKPTINLLLIGKGQRYIKLDNNEIQFSRRYDVFSVGINEFELEKMLNSLIGIAKKLDKLSTIDTDR